MQMHLGTDHSEKAQCGRKPSRLHGLMISSDKREVTCKRCIASLERLEAVRKTKTSAQTREQEDARDQKSDPSTCDFCEAPMRMRYQANDPENGPARLSCGMPACDWAREAAAQARRYAGTDGTTVDDLHEEALEEMQFDEAFPGDE